jgi:hypothetical protein
MGPRPEVLELASVACSCYDWGLIALESCLSDPGLVLGWFPGVVRHLGLEELWWILMASGQDILPRSLGVTLKVSLIDRLRSCVHRRQSPA